MALGMCCCRNCVTLPLFLMMQSAQSLTLHLDATRSQSLACTEPLVPWLLASLSISLPTKGAPAEC